MNEQSKNEKLLKFDFTISITHLISVFMIVVAVLGAWSSLGNRVTILEEQRIAHDAESRRMQEDVSEFRKIVREDVKDIREKINELILALSYANKEK